jgi:hypothetical protein
LLDERYADCGCERWSLRGLLYRPVRGDELVVRIVTSPDGFDQDTGELLTQKLSSVYSRGLSMVREGASEAEIRATIDELTINAGVERQLVGAVIIRVDQIRLLDSPPRCFCVYDTHAPEKTHHADLLGTFPRHVSNNQSRRIRDERRYHLCALFRDHLAQASTPDEVVVAVQYARQSQ